ncbi:hypothetical protein V1477_007661 [Vespula maculifrons]|uniref:Uncharacterized protein n=1 Tax=Vespula maculifrons TaxID=7453 RepID=A0ABD2CGG3_VESMC
MQPHRYCSRYGTLREPSDPLSGESIETRSPQGDLSWKEEKRRVLLASDFSHDTLHLAQEDQGGWPSLTGSPGLLVPFAAVAVAVADAALLPLEEFTGRWPADVYARWITSYGHQVVPEKRVSTLGHKRGARNDVAILSSPILTILPSFSSLSSEAHSYHPLCACSFASNLGLAHREEENPE